MPGSGKSTVFQALTSQSVAPQFLSMNIKPHQAVVKIPDPRLDKLGEVWQTKSVVQATMGFIDIPGFDPASTDRKLKNAVLEHYRQCDALALVVNLFDPEKAPDAAQGINSLLEELILLGLVSIERVLPRLKKMAEPKTAKEERAKYELLSRVKLEMEEGIPVRRMELSPEEKKLLKEYTFLSEKQIIAVLNLADDDFSKDDKDVLGLLEALKVFEAEGIKGLRLPALLETEFAGLAPEEAKEYMAEYGLSEPGLHRFIREASSVLQLKTFLTASDKECRAWLVGADANAQESAGVIHSDLARGFIRAETVSYADFIKHGNMAGAKAAGKVRLEGKEYLVKDGDILNIRFNV